MEIFSLLNMCLLRLHNVPNPLLVSGNMVNEIDMDPGFMDIAPKCFP